MRRKLAHDLQCDRDLQNLKAWGFRAAGSELFTPAMNPLEPPLISNYLSGVEIPLEQSVSSASLPNVEAAAAAAMLELF